MKENIKEPGLKAAIMSAVSGSIGTFEGKYKTITSEEKLYLRAIFVPVIDEKGTMSWEFNS